jgi:alkylation response protein AidB-like acyl-CoA dehydrogenase
MVNFDLSSEQEHWQLAARRLAREFGKTARAVDESGQFPHENMQRLQDAGFLKLAVPVEYGGHGNKAGFCSWIPNLVIEELGVECGGTAWCILTHYHACGLITTLAPPELKARIFKEVVGRGALIATCASEVHPALMQGERRKAGPLLMFDGIMQPVDGGFVINDKKGFTSIAKAADYLVLWTHAPYTQGNSDGLTMSIVSCKAPGLSFLPGWEDAVGLRCSESGGALFKDVFIPWENVMGQPGDYVQLHPYTFELSYAMLLLGLSQGASNFIKDTIKQREFLQEDDTVMYAVAELASELQAVRTSCWYAQWLWECDKFDDAHQATLRALHQAKSTSVKIATQGFDLVGVRGLFKFNPLERIWRDIRTVTLHTRESSFMKLLARGELRGEKFPKLKYGDKLSDRKTWDELLNDKELARD